MASSSSSHRISTSSHQTLTLTLTLTLALTLILLLAIAPRPASAATDAVFVFGDSLVDVGNNNYLPLGQAKASHLPNGIDFPSTNGHTPTGRFTNGLTIPDILGLKAGLKGFVPPYLAPSSHGQAIVHGVNYASGGGGILNETGRIFVSPSGFFTRLGFRVLRFRVYIHFSHSFSQSVSQS